MRAGTKHKFNAGRLFYAVIPYLIIVAVIVAWEIFVRVKGVQPIFLPAPSAILKYLIIMINICGKDNNRYIIKFRVGFDLQAYLTPVFTGQSIIQYNQVRFKRRH